MPAGDDVRSRVVKVIEQIRPAVQSDGGDLEFVNMNPEGIVEVRLHGACVGCPSSTATLKLGIERYLVEEVPEVKGVVCVN